MERRGLFAYAKKAALSEAEQRAWQGYMHGQPHACRTPEDWADLYATICNFKRRLMERNGVPVQRAERRARIMQHL
jgi:hypothetical protein